MSVPISSQIVFVGLLLCGLMALALTSLSSAADASRSRGCDISGQEDELGASYVTSLKVKNTGCGEGKKVVKAFNECRRKNGGANGKCKSRVKGYKCNEGKRSGVPGVQYNATVKCKDGGKKVIFSYTQNT